MQKATETLNVTSSDVLVLHRSTLHRGTQILVCLRAYSRNASNSLEAITVTRLRYKGLHQRQVVPREPCCRTFSNTIYPGLRSRLYSIGVTIMYIIHTVRRTWSQSQDNNPVRSSSFICFVEESKVSYALWPLSLGLGPPEKLPLGYQPAPP